MKNTGLTRVYELYRKTISRDSVRGLNHENIRLEKSLPASLVLYSVTREQVVNIKFCAPDAAYAMSEQFIHAINKQVVFFYRYCNRRMDCGLRFALNSISRVLSLSS